MILAALGANLPGPAGAPAATLEAALGSLEAAAVRVVARSRFYRTSPVPPSDQPDYVNAAVRLDTGLDAAELLALFHATERRFGRVRGARNAARSLDLDLLAYHDRVSDDADLALPHPRLHERRFVLVPLVEIAPDWRHPRLGATATELLGRLPPGEDVTVLVRE